MLAGAPVSLPARARAGPGDQPVGCRHARLDHPEEIQVTQTSERTSSATRSSGDLPGAVVLTVLVLSRLALFAVWYFVRALEYGDLNYYWEKTFHLGETGLATTLREYPTPVVWLLDLPQLLGGGSRPAYAAWFVIGILILDLAFCWVLWRFGGRFRGWAIAFWSVFLLLVGPLVWNRFDLVPAVLVGAAAVLAVRHPRTSGALLGIGAAIKLWPAALIPLLVNGRNRGRALVGFLITGGGLALISLAAGGWPRLISPLVWQGDRGLQIESVWATPLMLFHAFEPDRWEIRISSYQAFEIFGQGVGKLLLLSNVATVIGGLVVLAILIRSFFAAGTSGQHVDSRGLAIAMLAVIAIIIITNKTLSPQYIPWLGGPLAALVSWTGLGRGRRAEPDPFRSMATRWVVALLVIAFASQLVFPTLYDAINDLHVDDPWTPLATTALVVRNGLLVLFTLDLIWSVWRTPQALARERRTAAE
ncbi:hypothetical protein CGZ95_01650 [Enemella evansiae]|nr:hypothetical protein CGZ95_01650 [Enemella evansiae]